MSSASRTDGGGFEFGFGHCLRCELCINCGPARAIDTFVSVSVCVHPDYGQFELIWISLELFVKLFCNYRFGFELLLISPHWVCLGSFFNGRQVKGDLIRFGLSKRTGQRL